MNSIRALVGHRRRRTGTRGVYYVQEDDGTRSYIATWTEQKPINIADPLNTRPIRMEKRASTFDEACQVKAAAEVAERNKRRGQPEPNLARRFGERMMAAKWFEYWVRR